MQEKNAKDYKKQKDQRLAIRSLLDLGERDEAIRLLCEHGAFQDFQGQWKFCYPHFDHVGMSTFPLSEM